MTNFSQAYEACRRSQSCCVRRSAGIDVHRALRGFVPYLSNIHICNRNMCSACLHYLVHALEISVSLLFMQIYNINNLETYFLFSEGAKIEAVEIPPLKLLSLRSGESGREG